MIKDNCGVSCIRKLLSFTGKVDEKLIRKLEYRVNEEGLSFLNMMEVMNEYGYEVKAYRSELPYYETPYLMFDSKKKHYYLIMIFDDKYCYMYDPNIGDLKIYRKLFKSFWCQYYLTICYNKAE